MYQPVTVRSTMYPNACTNKAYSLAHLQALILTLAGVVTYIFIPAKVGIKSC